MCQFPPKSGLYVIRGFADSEWHSFAPKSPKMRFANRLPAGVYDVGCMLRFALHRLIPLLVVRGMQSPDGTCTSSLAVNKTGPAHFLQQVHQEGFPLSLIQSI